MHTPPSYRQLETRNRELKKRIARLRRNEENFRNLVENSSDGFLVLADSGQMVYGNRTAAEITGYPTETLVNLGIADLAHPDEIAKLENRFRRRLKGEDVPTPYVTAAVRRDGSTFPIEVSGTKTDWCGRPAVLVIFRDISDRMAIEKALYRSKQAMQRKVADQTRELRAKNRLLREKNTALKVLLDQRNKDRQDIHESLRVNIRELIEPYLEKIERGNSSQRRIYLSILKYNFEQITAPFMQRLSAGFVNLTPTEIRVAQLVKQGKNVQGNFRRIEHFQKNSRVSPGKTSEKNSV